MKYSLKEIMDQVIVSYGAVMNFRIKYDKNVHKNSAAFRIKWIVRCLNLKRQCRVSEY